MEKANKTELIRVRVTPEELHRIRAKMQELGIRNMSAYLRKMALDGICVQMDLSEIREMTYQIGRLGNNLNQIAKHANETGVVYPSEIRGIQRQFEEIIGLEKEILKSLSGIF